MNATALLQGGYEFAEQAWQESVNKLFSEEEKASRKKGCPRQAFFGLCAAGLVVNVSPNTYVKQISSLNGTYSVTAVGLLVSNPNLAQESQIELWRQVMSVLGLDTKKKHNQQMDVVMNLWEQKLIVIDRKVIN